MSTEQYVGVGYWDIDERDALVTLPAGGDPELAAVLGDQYDATHVRLGDTLSGPLGMVYVSRAAVLEHMLVEAQRTANFIESGDTVDLDGTPESFAERQGWTIID